MMSSFLEGGGGLNHPFTPSPANPPPPPYEKSLCTLPPLPPCHEESLFTLPIEECSHGLIIAPKLLI